MDTAKNHFILKITVLALIAAIVATVAFNIGFDKRQIVTLTVFSVSIMGALLFWQFRVSFAFFGSSVLLICGGILSTYRFENAE